MSDCEQSLYLCAKELEENKNLKDEMTSWDSEFGEDGLIEFILLNGYIEDFPNLGTYINKKTGHTLSLETILDSNVCRLQEMINADRHQNG